MLGRTPQNAAGIQPASVRMYRRVFEEYNLSFNKPKKDQCLRCEVFRHKDKCGSLTNEDKEEHAAHLNRKKTARLQKEDDTAKGKTNKAFHVATFDLEAVLYTPCSLVSTLYYKRKLATYNLSVYSHNNGQGTCYMLDESQAKRGSCEIATCHGA